MEPVLSCPKCKATSDPSYFFCPNCGKKLKEKLSTTIGKQISIYLASFFVPPSGLWWGVKYLRAQDNVSKRIGIAAIIITLLSLFLSIWYTIVAIHGINQAINTQLNSPMTGF